MPTVTTLNRFFVVVVLVGIVSITGIFSGCSGKGEGEVTVYTSVDEVFAEEIFRVFEKETGIKVNPVFDTEASKTTGLFHRLIAEKNNPRADVFWNSEVSRALMLRDAELLASYRSPSAADIPSAMQDSQWNWIGFAARSRVLVYNTKLLDKKDVPTSIFELTDEKWRGKFAIGNPLFGTTATHAAALFAELGEEKAKKFFTDLKNNDVMILEGNSTVRDFVARGDVKIGFTDTDDVWAGIDNNKPIDMIYPDQDGIGTLVIPNTVMLIRGAPHPAEARKFIDFLLSRDTERRLAFGRSRQIPVRSGVPMPPQVLSLSQITAMDVSFEKITENMDPAAEFIRKHFLK